MREDLAQTTATPSGPVWQSLASEKSRGSLVPAVQEATHPMHKLDFQLRALMSDASAHKNAATTRTQLPATTVCHIPRHKIKKVPVTSCDSCRLRKLKCNAKDLPQGTACQQCAKHNSPCTFEDRDEIQPTITKAKATPTRSNVAGRKRTSSALQSSGTLSSHRTRAKLPRSNSGDTYCNLAYSQHGWQPASAPGQPQGNGAWKTWNVPGFLTDPQSARQQHVDNATFISLLVNRFLDPPSFNLFILPPEIESVRHLRSGNLDAVPDYLLYTIVACASTGSFNKEPEIFLWRAHIWRNATERVYLQLNSSEEPTIELLQSLLLLSCNWPGSLERAERINTFDYALKIAGHLQLMQSAQVNCGESGRSLRLALVWTIYCYDKLLSTAIGAAPRISFEEVDIPLPSAQLIGQLTPMNEVECAWTQRLCVAAINLCRLTEDIVNANAILATQKNQITSLHQLQDFLRPVEQLLEEFCKDHKWLLSIDTTALAPVCQKLTESVVSLLHICQLEFYLPALHFESSRRANHGEHSIEFSPENHRALAACVESAWHLVQQTSSVFPLIAGFGDSWQGSTDKTSAECMTLAKAGASKGTQAFQFLAQSWCSWNDGRGCALFAPSVEFLEDSQPRAAVTSDCQIGGLTEEAATMAAAHYARGYQQQRELFDLPQQHEQFPHTKATSISVAGTGVEEGRLNRLEEKSTRKDSYITNTESDEVSLQNASKQRVSTRRNTLPHPLNLVAVNEVRTGDSESVPMQKSPLNEISIPLVDGQREGSVPPSRCDTAAMANMLLSTPARLLFHGIEEGTASAREERPVREQATLPAPSPVKATFANGQKAFAMLTPINATFIDETIRLERENISTSMWDERTLIGEAYGENLVAKEGASSKENDKSPLWAHNASSKHSPKGESPINFRDQLQANESGSSYRVTSGVGSDSIVGSLNSAPRDGGAHCDDARTCGPKDLRDLRCDMEDSYEDDGTSYLASAVGLLRSSIRML